MERLPVISLLLLLLLAQPAAIARPAVYYYDGDAPMITFMLEMMESMGVIDEIPPAYLRQGNLGQALLQRQYGMNRMYPYGPRSRHNFYSRYYPNLPWDAGHDRPYLRHAGLDGVWISSSGDILGINSNRMVWGDGEKTYAVGLITTTPRYIYARLNGATTSTPYSYSLAGNQLNLRDIDGSVRRFYRLPNTARAGN